MQAAQITRTILTANPVTAPVSLQPMHSLRRPRARQKSTRTGQYKDGAVLRASQRVFFKSLHRHRVLYAEYSRYRIRKMRASGCVCRSIHLHQSRVSWQGIYSGLGAALQSRRRGADIPSKDHQMRWQSIGQAEEARLQRGAAIRIHANAGPRSTGGEVQESSSGASKWVALNV